VGEVWGGDRSWGMGRGYGNVRERGHEGCGRVYEGVRGVFAYIFFLNIYIYIYIYIYFFFIYK
jgi:hypothetical protein